MSIDNDNAPDESGDLGERAADLRALERAAGADPQNLPDPDEPPPPVLPALSEEIAGALMLLSKMAAPIFPSVAAIYTDEVCASVGAAVQPVCDKHGWLQGGMTGEWGPEIMCLVVVGPLAYATVTAAKGDIAARNAAKRKEGERTGDIKQIAPGAAPQAVGASIYKVPGSDTVSFGAPVAA